MKFTIKNPGGSIITLLRKAGYSSFKDSFIKSLGRAGFPRFHVYITQEKDDLIFNLHLDQKNLFTKELLLILENITPLLFNKKLKELSKY